jgi:hypothetical protein
MLLAIAPFVSLGNEKIQFVSDAYLEVDLCSTSATAVGLPVSTGNSHQSKLGACVYGVCKGIPAPNDAKNNNFKQQRFLAEVCLLFCYYCP